ncbi:MAG: nucleotidyltransferase domain-containing protein [Verrucomicrobiota bacterium]
MQSTLTGLLKSRLRAKVLGWLFTHPDEEFFVRQLKGLLREDATNMSRELAHLTGLGLLTCRARGVQKYYQVNPNCPVYGELRGLVLKSFGMADILRNRLMPLDNRIRAAFIHGSQAMGKATAASDVDVMIIGDVTFAEVVKALGPAQEALGREVNPVVYPVAEFRNKLAHGHHFLTSVMKEPKIFLVGRMSELTRLAEKRLGGRT